MKTIIVEGNKGFLFKKGKFIKRSKQENTPHLIKELMILLK